MGEDLFLVEVVGYDTIWTHDLFLKSLGRNMIRAQLFNIRFFLKILKSTLLVYMKEIKGYKLIFYFFL